MISNEVRASKIATSQAEGIGSHESTSSTSIFGFLKSLFSSGDVAVPSAPVENHYIGTATSGTRRKSSIRTGRGTKSRSRSDIENKQGNKQGSKQGNKERTKRVEGEEASRRNIEIRGCRRTSELENAERAAKIHPRHVLLRL